jgi:hypothetical protein
LKWTSKIGLEEIVRYKRTLTGAVELTNTYLLRYSGVCVLEGHWLGRVVERCSTTILQHRYVVEGLYQYQEPKGTIRAQCSSIELSRS